MEEQKKNLMTEEGKKKLEDELQDLKLVQRPAIAKKIGEARELGDLSENAEYDAAKDEHGKIEDSITNREILEDQLMDLLTPIPSTLNHIFWNDCCLSSIV